MAGEKKRIRGPGFGNLGYHNTSDAELFDPRPPAPRRTYGSKDSLPLPPLPFIANVTSPDHPTGVPRLDRRGTIGGYSTLPPLPSLPSSSSGLPALPPLPRTSRASSFDPSSGDPFATTSKWHGYAGSPGPKPIDIPGLPPLSSLEQSRLFSSDISNFNSRQTRAQVKKEALERWQNESELDPGMLDGDAFDSDDEDLQPRRGRCGRRNSFNFSNLPSLSRPTSPTQGPGRNPTATQQPPFPQAVEPPGGRRSRRNSLSGSFGNISLESDLAALGLPPITDRQRAEWGLPQLPGLVDSRRGSGSGSGSSRSTATPPPLPSMPFFELGGKGRPRQPQGPSRKSSANWSGEDQSFLGMPPFSGISPSQRNILLPESGSPMDSPFGNLPPLNRSSTSTSGMSGQRRRGSIGGMQDLTGRSGSGYSSTRGLGPATPLDMPRGATAAQPWSGYGDLPPLSGLPPWEPSSQSGRSTPKRR